MLISFIFIGVATFCRVKSVFLSTEVALPVAAEEGFTGFIDRCRRKEGLEEFEKDELVKVDSEGRCVVTDHNHFGAFNVKTKYCICYVLIGNLVDSFGFY